MVSSCSTPGADEAVLNDMIMITCLLETLVARGVVHYHVIERKSRFNLLSGIKLRYLQHLEELSLLTSEHTIPVVHCLICPFIVSN
jgi:hypothetical protein